MKKLILTFSALAALAIGANAQELKKDPFVFNHLGIGVTAGLDGIGGDLVLPVGRHLQIRGGYSFSYPFSYTTQSTHVTASKADGSPWDIDGDIAGKARLATDGGRLMFDLYPGRKGGFHFTVGAYYGTSKDGFLALSSASPLPIPESDWGRSGIELSRGEDPAVRLTTDRNGVMKLDLRMENPVGEALGMPALRPYAGLGFGRNLKEDGHVAFTFDIGAIYCGSMGIYGWDYMSDLEGDGVPVKILSSDIAAVEDAFNMDPGTLTRYSDKAFGIMDKIPVCPVLKFSLVFKIF